MAGPSYATLTDLATYGVSANALQTIPSVNQQAALDTASEYVASYLGSRFVLPLKSWGADIRRAASIIAAYDLMFVRGYNPADGPDPELAKRHDDIVKWLNKIAEGKAVPEVQDSSVLAATDPGGGGAFTRQMTIQQTADQNTVNLSLNGAPPQIQENGTGGVVIVGSPQSRGW